VQQAVKVNSKLGKNSSTHCRNVDIARKKRNASTGISYYRYKVCSKYGHVEKNFARNQLLHDEHLTASVLGIDVNKDADRPILHTTVTKFTPCYKQKTKNNI
jgi:hypothetical protein